LDSSDVKQTFIQLGLVALLLGHTTAQAQRVGGGLLMASPDEQGFSPARLQRLDRFAQALTQADGYLGAVTLVARDGRVVAVHAHGWRDLAKTSPMAVDSIFRIYSMTKTIATVVALQLMEEGKLALDDPVGKYLPEFGHLQVMAGGSADAPQLRAPKRPVTIRHLLTHTAGFATGGAQGNDEAVRLFNRFDLHQSASLKDYAAYVARQPLARDPGERFVYDGVGLEVLARLMEVVSGQPLDVVLQQRVLQPLRMKDTSFSVPPEKRQRIADMVTTNARGQLVLASTPDALHPGDMLNPYPSAAGGLYSTAQDYLRFCQMLLNGGTLDGQTILGRKTVALMMQNQLAQVELPPGQLRDGDGFGLGGYVVLDVARHGGLGSVGQFGWSGAGATYYTVDPQEHLVALLLMQHLPQGLPRDPPKVSLKFYNLVYQALVN
jgi:CubicO group peptidase (beta-lactamase class C family)